MDSKKRAIPRGRCLAVLLSGAALLLTTGVASAQPPQHTGVTLKPHSSVDAILPQMSCATLRTHDFTAVPDAASRISSTADASLNGTTYCAVKGYIAPQTSFELLLPETTWHGDYAQEGCGGYCGAVHISTQPAVSTGCPQVAGNELVLATDDQGHESPSGTDGTWAADDLTLRVVFGYTSEHSLANLAKAAIRVYYGTGPAESSGPPDPDAGQAARAARGRHGGMRRHRRRYPRPAELHVQPRIDHVPLRHRRGDLPDPSTGQGGARGVPRPYRPDRAQPV